MEPFVPSNEDALEIEQHDRVKIKGFAVDLNEVTAVVGRFPGITRACVTLVDNTLYGFYSTTTFIDEHDLDVFVREHLPHHSVSTKWVYVASIPLSPDGRTDEKQLARLALRAHRPLLSSRRTSTFSTKDLYLPAKLETPIERNAEKIAPSDLAAVVSSNLSAFNVSTTSIAEQPDALPPKSGVHGQRWLRHRLFDLYCRFFTIVIVANIAAACFILYRNIKDDRFMLSDLATATSSNLCMAVLLQSEPVINILFAMFCSVPTSWPLAVRRHCARIFHIGGIHSGCVIASVLWFSIFTIGASMEFGKPAAIRCLTLTPEVLTYLLWPFLISIACAYHRSIRLSHRDMCEYTRRFGGWTGLVLLWIQTAFAAKDLAYEVSMSHALLHSPSMWLLTVITIAVFLPWLTLRKVSVRSEVLSSTAIRLWFEYTTPMIGTSVRIAERPFADWHSVSTITNTDANGFSLLVSNAGEFTKRTISRAPTSIYVRGIPTCGVLRTTTLFKSIVLVATGSGIGPCLAILSAKKIPCRVLWIVPTPEETFGKDIIDRVLDCDPKAIIHNTATQGNPDMNLMTYQLWKESGAEAVYVVGTKESTTSLVYAIETRGVPAYGAISESHLAYGQS
jgi:hypothetical protein